MSRNAYGDGSVYQRKDGRWVATFTNNGKRFGVYGRTRQEAVKARRVHLEQVAKGATPSRARRTFATEAQRWIDTVSKETGLSDKSRRVYVDVLNLHVIPVIGSLKVTDVRPSDVTSVMVAMQEHGLSASYRHQAHKALSHVFKMAMRDGLIVSNPVRDVTAPRGSQRKKVVPSRDQVLALIDAAGDERTRTGIMLLAHTGARIGEVLALRWSDVDFTRARITIRTGKGGKGRSVALTATLAAQLKVWRKQQTAMRLAASWWSQESDPWLLSTDIGTQMDAHNWRKKHFAPVARTVAVGVTPHSLRHAFATLMLEEGVPTKVVAEQLGHSSTRITEDTYSHVTARLVDEAGLVAERVLGGAG